MMEKRIVALEGQMAELRIPLERIMLTDGEAPDWNPKWESIHHGEAAGVNVLDGVICYNDPGCEYMRFPDTPENRDAVIGYAKVVDAYYLAFDE